jgi:hypothetical protein
VRHVGFPFPQRSHLVRSVHGARAGRRGALVRLTLPAEASARLDEATALDLAHPYMFFAREIQRMVNGGTHVTAW